jgi:pimeloyl-ACP methyl ester carboxylesterase
MLLLTSLIALARVPHPADVPAIDSLGAGPLPPLATVHHEGHDDDTLVVLLPGVLADHHALAHRGVVQALRDGGLGGDIVAVHAHVGYYAQRSISERLVEDVLLPARERYDNVWVVGISMGGLGGSLAARDAPELVDGLILLSPWLGRPGAVAPIHAAGGVDRWTPSAGGPWEHELWTWLQAEHAAGWRSAEVHLGYGHRDLVVDNHHLLADALGEESVLRVRGGHAWRTWRWLARELAPRVGAVAVAEEGRL